MLSLNRRGCVTVALMALASFVGIATADARGEEARERQEHRPSETQRQGPRREAAARQSHRGFAAQTTHAREHPVINHRPEMVGRSVRVQRQADGSLRRDTHLAGGGQVHEVSRVPGAQQVRVVRYGNAVSGSVERTIRPGVVSRTFVSGGHVLYTRVYEHHVWQHFGRAFAYETFVPAVRYPAVYYGWALAAWPHPITYSWGWQAQPWYPAYGVLFTPYPVYTSPDLWMTDYIIAQSMQTAYQAQTAAPASVPAPDASIATPVAEPGAAAVVQPSEAMPVPQPGASPSAPQLKVEPPAPSASPPAVTPQIKAQLDTQIKVQLQEQQAAVATPASLTTQSTPPALRPNHVFYQVVQPLDVPSGTPNRYCSLSPDDYIKRTGGMSGDDWMIPVVVELSGPSDCPVGLHTRIGLNDLNAMENEQEAQVMEALREASKSMGPNGPPGGSGVHPTLIADGSAAPDPGALDAIRQAQ